MRVLLPFVTDGSSCVVFGYEVEMEVRVPQILCVIKEKTTKEMSDDVKLRRTMLFYYWIHSTDRFMDQWKL